MDAERLLASYRHRVREIRRRAAWAQQRLATVAGTATSSAEAARQAVEVVRPLLGEDSAAMSLLQSKLSTKPADGRRL